MALTRFSNGFVPTFPSLFNQLLEGNLTDWDNKNYASENSTLPAVNVKETNDFYQIELAAPGMKKEEFKLNYDNGQLTISSEHKEEEKKGKISRCEFSYQAFQRSFSVPADEIDVEKIEAKYTDGILYITLPKREEVKPKPAKVIEIN